MIHVSAIENSNLSLQNKKEVNYGTTAEKGRWRTINIATIRAVYAP